MPEAIKLPNAEPAAESVVRGASKTLPNFDFDTPDEASMQFLEEQWLRFCRSVGLQGDVPDIRAILAARDKNPPPPRARHWLVRPFVGLYDWLLARS